MEEKIKRLLASVVHPETGQDIVSSGFIEHTASAEGKVTVVLRFAKARDPFAVKIKNQAESLLREAFPGAEVLVVIKEGGAAPRPEPKLKTTTGGIARVIAVASGKGGVGKSTVTANLAIALRNMGFRVGVLDADIYGPSQPKMFGVEGYMPEAVAEDGVDHIVPAESMDVKLMSIGFFIKPTDALLWRGAMAVSALKQMIHQTRWGTLDFLLTDLPPGTGDVHLSIIGELKIDAAVIVSPWPTSCAAWRCSATKTSTSPWRASSRTWRGSRPPNCPKTATTSSAAAGHAHTPKKAGWSSWEKYLSSSRLWTEQTQGRRQRELIPASRNTTAGSPKRLSAK